LPGIVFGASIQLAGAVSFRLVVILAVLVGLVLVTLWVTRVPLQRAVHWASVARRPLSVWANNREGPAASLMRRLLNFDRAALAITMTASAVALLCAGVFFRVLRDVIGAAPFLQIDVSVYRFMQSVRNPSVGQLYSADQHADPAGTDSDRLGQVGVGAPLAHP
jgi:undecaprenyl-diphosphatase